MYRATTPTLRYKFSGASPDDFADILITISQNGAIVLTKHKEDCSIDGDTVSVDLTQEEANLIKEGVASTQVRAITPVGGKVHASDPIEFYMADVLDDSMMEVPDE